MRTPEISSDRSDANPANGSVTRLYYVLYVPDEEICAYIDGIRYLSDPSEKWRAHITVRGPYTSAIDREPLNKLLVGNVIRVYQIDRFKEPGQNTVIFRCDGSRLRRVWHKPDFPYNPHITLYDGSCQSFADDLEDVAGRYHYDFTFMSDRLQPMVAVQGAQRLDLLLSYDPVLLTPVLGEYVPAGEVRNLPADRRLQLIDKLCRRLSTLRSGEGHATGEVSVGR